MMIGDEVSLLDDVRGNASTSFGRPQKFQHPDRELRDGDRCELDDQFTMEVISTPGHTKGSACYMLWKKVDSGEEPFALITGDTLFDNGWGRTDFATGDDRQMRLISNVSTASCRTRPRSSCVCRSWKYNNRARRLLLSGNYGLFRLIRLPPVV